MPRLYPRFPLWLCLCFSVLLSGCDQPERDRLFDGRTMGTGYTVRISDCDQSNCDSVQAALAARLAELTQRLSHYEASSELTAFNNHSGTDWFPVSADLASVVAYALTVSRQSNGAFDISIAPAVDAWGFGPQAADLSEPGAEILAKARQHSGYTRLESRTSPPAIRKQDALIRLDLSAIAKGYAVDQLAYLLEDKGMRNYLVEIGGEIRTAGTRSDGTPWRIGIEAPADALGIEFVVLPGDAAVATSGDYRNFYMLEDRRVTHTINPATAEPVANNLASVSVIAPDAMQADALATALMVMGPQSGLEFAERRNIAALFFERTDNSFRTFYTAEFGQYLLAD